MFLVVLCLFAMLAVANDQGIVNSVVELRPLKINTPKAAIVILLAAFFMPKTFAAASFVTKGERLFLRP